MDVIAALRSKKNTEAYQLLLLLEQQSEERDDLYALFDDLLGLLGDKSSYVRVRGFRLACAQAKWDREGKIGQNLDRLLAALDDEKPAAWRHCIPLSAGSRSWRAGLKPNWTGWS